MFRRKKYSRVVYKARSYRGNAMARNDIARPASRPSGGIVRPDIRDIIPERFSGRPVGGRGRYIVPGSVDQRPFPSWYGSVVRDEL